MKRVLVSLAVMLLIATAMRAQTNKQAPPSAPSSPHLAEAKRAIDQGNAEWIEAWEKGDPSLVAALFTEDGSILSSDGKVIKGRQQIRERQKAGMAYVGRGVKVTATTTDMWVDGDTAYEAGKFSYKYQHDGKPVVDEGRYVTIWKRQKDGSWKLFIDMLVP
jgi:uncharacterized protein (TIGR02246 family)